MTARGLLLALPFLLTLAGCAGTGEPTASAPPSATPSSSANRGPSSAASTPAGRRIELTVAGGEVSGDTGRVPVPLGAAVTLVVTSDVVDEVHVHGYDLTAPLSPGTAELTFDAGVPGVFEVELEESGRLLLTLQVG